MNNPEDVVEFFKRSNRQNIRKRATSESSSHRKSRGLESSSVSLTMTSDSVDSSAPNAEVVEEGEVRNKEKSRIPVLAKKHQPQLLHMQDHFTLPTPSSTIRFRNRNNCARVYENKQTQMVMEETYNPETDQSDIIVRRLDDSTQSLHFLRLTYSLVCALWTGFFFVFCLQALLFMVLDLAIVSGATAINADINYVQCIGVTIAIIVFVYGFADALTIAGHYVIDAYSGHYLVKQFCFRSLNDVAVDWIFFVFFLFVPVMTMCITLLAGLNNWWAITSIVWFSCVCGFFVIFCANVVYYEVGSAYNFAKNIKDGESDAWKDVIKRCIILRQRHDYSGKQKIMFLAKSHMETTEDTEDVNKAEIYESTREEKIDLWSKFTQWGIVRTDTPGGLRLFKPLEVPKRLFTIDDVQDYRPFLTSQTWSLERIYCRPKNSRYIAIIDGPGHLTKAQIRSSLLCSAIGTCMIVSVAISFFFWMEIKGSFIAFAFALCLLLAWNSLSNARKLMSLSRNLWERRVDAKAEHAAAAVARVASDASVVEPVEKDEEALPEGATPPGEESDAPESRPSEAVFLIVQYRRVTRTTTKFCWIMFGLEVSFWYLYPLVTLFTIENLNMAILFIIVATITSSRHYINAAVLIEETGDLDLVGGDTEQDVWANKSRLSDIVQAITTGKSRNLWATLLGIVGLSFMAIFLSAVGTSTESTYSKQLTFLPPAFSYPSLESDMRYPSCKLANIKGGFAENSTMLDFAFLSDLVYKTDEIINADLQSWFTDTIVEHNITRVDEFRAREDKDNAAVKFHLMNFPEKSLALIMIRGTQTNWDMLADSQLWSAAALMQIIRSILPLGEIWTPILDRKLFGVNLC
jgi:hypothetical protein